MYDEKILQLIWHASWILSLISLVILAILIVVRSVRESSAAAYDARHAELQRMLLIHLENPLSELQETFVQKKYDLEILAKLAQKILRTVSGQSRERIHSFIHILKLEEWIYSRTQQGNKRDRMAAIQLLGYLSSTGKHEQILADILENEKDIHLCYIAAESLSKLGNVKSFPKVLKALQRLDALSSLLIYDIFRRFGPEACDRLIKAAKSKTTPANIKIAAIRALGEITTEESQDALVEHCSSDHGEMSANAFLALSKLALPIPNNTIAHGAEHPFWKVRMYTADCAKYAENFPIENLQTLLKDDNWMVSIHAAEALYSYGGAGQRILEMIAGQNSIAAQRASSFLAEKEGEADA